jgi:putative iron-regulated protein
MTTAMRARMLRGLAPRVGYPGALLLCALATGCATKGAGDTRRELLTSWSTGIAVEGYRSFENETRALDAALVDYCAEPSEAGLAAARDAWWQARTPWEQLEVFTFGPYSRLPLRIGPKIDQWPQRTPLEEVEELLESERAVTPEAVNQMGVNQKGLQVAEYLLFAPDAASALANARRCEYLVSVGKELVTRATELREAWDPAGGDFAGELSEAGRGRTAFDDLTDAFSEVVNRLAFTLEDVRTEKLLKPLGPDNGAPAPELVESRFSGRTVDDMRDNIAGIELVYFGDPTRNVLGLDSYLSERGRSYAPQTTEHLSAIRGALDAIPEPMTEAVSVARERIEAASAAVDELRLLIQVDIINTLGLQVSFNDNDGD